MPLRRVPGPPDLSRVVAVLGGAPPGQLSPQEASAGQASPKRSSGQASPGQEVHPAKSPRPATPGWVPAAPSAAAPSAGAPSAAARVGGTPNRPVDEIARLDADLRNARRPSLLTVPGQLRSGRLAVSSAAVVAVLALALALGCVFAVRVLWAERSADSALEPVAVATPRVSVERNHFSGSNHPATGSAMTTTSPAGQVVVHVVGQVKRPGLVRLPPGARVADAIAAAGGATRSGDLSGLNLARVLVDGEQVHVLRPGEAPAAAASGSVTGGSGAAGSVATDGLVNLNTADLTALDTLPGVGPVLAQRILDWRAEHGRFTSVEELGEVTGIGDKLYAQIRPKVTL